MNLPYLNENKWPISKEAEERVVNPSHDTALQDHLVDEFLMAMEHRNPSRIREALVALIHAIKNEDSEENQ